MKKCFISLFVAAVLALTFTSCSEPTNPGAPVINEMYFTTNNPDVDLIKNWPRLDEIYLFSSSSEAKEAPDSAKSALVIDFSDNEVDVTKLHYSFNNFQKDSSELNINCKYTEQTT